MTYLCFFHLLPGSLTASLPLKIYKIPKGKAGSSSKLHVSGVLAVKLGGVYVL